MLRSYYKDYFDLVQEVGLDENWMEVGLINDT